MADLLPTDNYLQDTRPKEEQVLNNITDTVKNITDTPTNVPIVISSSFQKLTPILQGYDYGYGNLLYTTPREDNLFFGLDNTNSNKINNVKDIILSCIINISTIGGIFDTLANFNFPIYLNIFKELKKGQTTATSSLLEPFMAYPLGNLFWTNDLGFYMSTDLCKDFRLSDYIETRLYITTDGLYDFRNTNDKNSNNKITQAQYTSLLNNNDTFLAYITYNPTGLTAGQISLINGVLGTDVTYSQRINLSLKFKYFGLLANYIPVNI